MASEHDLDNQQLEQRLREALQPEAPDDGFEDRVLARLSELSSSTEPHRPQVSRQRYRVGALALAASTLLVLGASFEMQRQQARTEARQAQLEGEHAKEQLLLALRIASEKTNFARERVQRSADAAHP